MHTLDFIAIASYITRTDNNGNATPQMQVDRFADGEVNVMVKENVRGKDVYIIQPTCMPVNENLVELLLMVREIDLGGRGSFERCEFSTRHSGSNNGRHAAHTRV